MILSNNFCELLQHDDDMLVALKISKQNLPKNVCFGAMALHVLPLAENLFIPHQEKSPSQFLTPPNFYSFPDQRFISSLNKNFHIVKQ